MRDVLSRRLRTELWLLTQYFFISFLAAFFAYDYLTAQMFGPLGDVDINLAGLFRNMWRGFLRPWLLVFLGLSAIRIAMIMFIVHFRTEFGDEKRK